MTEYAQPTSMEEWETFQPYAMWARGRETDQVIRFDGYVADDQPSFHVTRYADAERVLRDWETFSSSINGEIIGRYMGDLILAMNGKEHRQYRNLVAHAFRASVLDRWDAQLVRPVIDELLDEIAPLGRADLVASVTSRYPVQVICGIVGVPLEDHAQFARWAEEINMGPLHPERGHGGVGRHARLPRTRSWPRDGWSRRATCSASSCTRRSTASVSPTRRSTASSGCCCPPERRRRSG